MNKLTAIFIAAALAISAGLVIAQNQIDAENAASDHNMPGHTMPTSDNPSDEVPHRSQ